MRASLLVLAMLVEISSADAQSEQRRLILEVGGGLPGARRLTVQLLGAGDFHATGAGLPFTKTGLTKFEHRQTVSTEMSAALLRVATQAAAEWQGTAEVVPDCKWATLEIETGPKRIKLHSGCISSSWVSRPSVKDFLASFDRLLPAGWTLGEVVSF